MTKLKEICMARIKESKAVAIWQYALYLICESQVQFYSNSQWGLRFSLAIFCFEGEKTENFGHDHRCLLWHCWTDTNSFQFIL